MYLPIVVRMMNDSDDIGPLLSFGSILVVDVSSLNDAFFGFRNRQSTVGSREDPLFVDDGTATVRDRVKRGEGFFVVQTNEVGPVAQFGWLAARDTRQAMRRCESKFFFFRK